MLKIRQEQFDALKCQSEVAFVDRIIAFLLMRYPDLEVQIPTGQKTIEELDRETLRGMVQAGVARAREYAMTWETSLTSFVMLMFLIAPNFDEHLPIRLTLKNEKIDPEERIDRVCEQATVDTWEAARQAYDIKAWKLKAEAAQEEA